MVHVTICGFCFPCSGEKNAGGITWGVLFGATTGLGINLSAISGVLRPLEKITWISLLLNHLAVFLRTMSFPSGKNMDSTVDLEGASC